MKRRAFLGAGAMLTTLGAAVYTGLVVPVTAFARAWTRDVFALNNTQDVVDRLFGGETATAATAVRILVPAQSDGLSVPVKLTADLSNIETMALLTDDGNTPLAATLSATGAVSGYGTRIRLSRTSTITALVKANGRLYSAVARVKVTKGGYGMTQ